MATSFIAYPASPPIIGDTIEAAANSLTVSNYVTSVETWRQVDIAGQFIANQILARIAKKDFFIADISVLNFNVTYEIGFAIGRKKRTLLLQNRAISDGRKEIEQIGIFDTIGWKEYENHLNVVDHICGATARDPINFDDTKINKKAPVYLLDAKYKSDPIIRIMSRIKKANIYFCSFDPSELNRMSAYEAIDSVAHSIGVLVSLLPSMNEDSRAHNLRASFLAGLAEGMGKELAILQLGDDPVPLDYRELVHVCRHPDQIAEAIGAFAAQIARVFQTEGPPIVSEAKTFLATLTLGATAAENEFRDLASYYLETDAFARALSALRGEVRIVLGRKGSGKTALFAQVRDRARGDKSNIVVDLKPDGYKLLKFKEDVISLLQEGTVEHTIMAFWEYVLLLEIAYKILEKDEIPHTRNPKLYEPYRELYGEYHADEYISEGDFSERMAKLLEAVRVDFSLRHGDGIQRRLNTPEITELLYKHNLGKLLANIKSYLAHKGDVWLLIDNIDKGWSTHGIKEEDLLIVRTLLDATRKIERDLSANDTRCETLVFLRNDVYDLLVKATPDRGKEAKVLIDWSDPDSLKELIRRRLAFNGLPRDIEFQKIWNEIVESHVNGEESFGYLVERSLMRPRALISLINHCRGFAVNRGHDRIEQEDIRKGMEVYSRDLVQEISYEIADIFPDVQDPLYAFIGINSRITKEMLLAHFEELGISKENANKLVDLFLWYGVIGYVDKDEEKYIYTTNYDIKLLQGIGRRIASGADELYCVNRAFWPGLAVNDLGDQPYLL